MDKYYVVLRDPSRKTRWTIPVKAESFADAEEQAKKTAAEEGRYEIIQIEKDY